uniref:C2H2-type domain-containing protein n=1 Tax=Leersia perrieri TaxID=77586 RepID=A0A0D9XIN4_9ORYZ
MEGDTLLAEIQVALASRCYSLSAMHKSNMSPCPTITYEEALKRELEYRQKIERSYPHLLVGLNGAPALLKEVGSCSSPDLLMRKSAHDSYTPRPNLVPSFWCKICKVDCVTEFNFGAHIGGKKHKAKKLEILGNRNTARPVTVNQWAGNINPGPNGSAGYGSRNNEPNMYSSNFTKPSSDTSDSQTNGIIESTHKGMSSDGDGTSNDKPDENC